MNDDLVAKMIQWDERNNTSDVQILLLVDDDLDFAQTLREQLKPYGTKLRFAHSTEELEKQLASEPISLLLVAVTLGDHALPDIEAVLAERRAGRLHVPLVFVSSRGDIPARLEAVRADCDGFLVKPFDVRSLVQLIHRLTFEALDNPYRVLLVGDDAEGSRCHASLLQAAGMRCTEVNQPLKLIEPLLNFNPDVILIDVNLPECSGFELASIIRQYSQYIDTPIIFLSAEANIGRHLCGIQVEGDEILPQSINPDNLLSRMHFRAKRARERQQLVSHLTRSERRFYQAMNFANVGMWDWDMGTDRLLCTERIPPMLGYPSGELETSHADFLSSVHPEDRAGLRQAFNACIHGDHDFTHEYRVVWHDGTVRWLLERGDVIKDAQGKPTRMLGVLQDITDRKQIEQQRQQAQQAADAANQAKSIFLATMSHEIRTPMNGVLGMVELLALSTLNLQQAQQVRVIRDSGQALLQLIDNILDFSKIEAGRMELEQTPFSVEALMEGVYSLLLPVAINRGVTLDRFCSPVIPAQIIGDSNRLRQVLFNLISNALKFTESNDGRVMFRAELVTADPLVIDFKVVDNGIGIHAENLAGLFTPFTQAETSTTRRFGGSGLGLSICQRLVKLMGGDIKVESQIGQGSQFQVTLPVAAAPQAKPAAARKALSRLHCVLVEGNGLATHDLRAYLKPSVGRISLIRDYLQLNQMQGMAQQTLVIYRDATPNASRLDLGLGAHLPLLRLADGRRSNTRPEGPGLMTLDGNPPVRWALLRAVEQATGLSASYEGIAPQRAELAARQLLDADNEAPFTGPPILVAEDDVTNRQVIAQQLEALGYPAKLAQDGEQALAMWRNGNYSLLLTDLHMPRLDGYQLTRAIRCEAGARRTIIALTANALRGEAERCKALGMDDYLTKPIQLNCLRACLRQWLHQDAPAQPGPPPQMPTGEQTGNTAKTEHQGPLALLDTSVLEALIGGDVAQVPEFLQSYRRQLLLQAAQLQQAIQDGEYGLANALAHKLKSASRSVGALALGECCAALERAAQVGNEPALSTLQKKFLQLQDQVVEAIDQRLLSR